MRGFSLIEILVVVVIVGIVAFVVVLSIGGDADRHLRHEAERFQALVGEACAEAQLRGREIGAVVAADGYSFRVLVGGAWQDYGTDGILRRRAWLDGVRPDLAREGRPVDLARDADATATRHLRDRFATDWRQIRVPIAPVARRLGGGGRWRGGESVQFHRTG